MVSSSRILQALYYIQSNAPKDNPDRFHRTYFLKIIYFADRYHLRRYGFTATDDSYYAMKLGPVASATYDILKSAKVKEISEYEVFIDDSGDDDLPESFKESLNFALSEFGKYGWAALSSITHKYPEWKKHEPNIPHNRCIAMDIRDFFDDPQPLYAPNDPFKEDREFLESLREDFDADYIPD